LSSKLHDKGVCRPSVVVDGVDVVVVGISHCRFGVTRRSSIAISPRKVPP
jgi:hypothetical protein